MIVNATRVFALAILAASAATAQIAARHGLTPAGYQAAFNDLTSKGYRPIQVTGYTSNGSERYAALFTKAPGGSWVAKHGLSASSYQQHFTYYAGLGYRLTWISGYQVGGEERYAAIWEQKAGGAWVAKHGMSSASYQQNFTTYAQQGYRLVHINSYTVDGGSRYAAIWEMKAGPSWIAKHGMTAAAYQAAFTDLASQGFRVTDVTGHNVGGVDYYAAIWESGGPAWGARHGVPEAWYQGVYDNFFYQSYQPAYINAFASGSSAKFNCVFTNTVISAADLQTISQKVTAYMTTNGVPGLALAISRDEKLIYAAGFGDADSATGEDATATSLFRIASVSKPITSVAIMRLTQTHGLDLDRNVFGPGGILTSRFPTPKGNERINQITVRHLLRHTSGFHNSPNDPMFQNTSMTHDELIKWVLSSSDRFVTRNPDTRYEYSNFGFCLLGRVIEQISGQTYEQYVKANVLNPAGATKMTIAANSAAAKKPREVSYYPSGAYNLNVTRFDAHGGWIGSPIDLLRFLSRVDGMLSKPDILSAADRTEMLTRANVLDVNMNNPGYALGWAANVSQTQHSHNGAMSGTGAQLIRYADGYSIAVVMNRRPPAPEDFLGGVGPMVRDIISSTTLPSVDLF